MKEPISSSVMGTVVRSRRSVVVIGGGISGLSAAHALTAGPTSNQPEVILLEAMGRLGGKVLTTKVGGLQVEAGPDALLTRTPAAVNLCRRLGLGDQLVAPSRAAATIWSRGRLHPIPGGLALGVPTSMTDLARSGILSWRGIARAAVEPLLPNHPPGGDRSVADLVITRFGGQVFERLVDPLLSGIYAGRADRLSAESVLPQLAELARTNRSLLLGLRKLPKPRAGGPPFNSLSSGLGTLVAALEDAIRPAAEVRTGTPATSVRLEATGTYLVQADGQPPLRADAVIIAAPAYAASEMLAAASPYLGVELGAIEYASVATVALVYSRKALTRPLDASGFLVPRGEKRLLVGSTWVGVKWPHLDSGNRVVIRCAVGRTGDDRWQSLDDRGLANAVHAELTEAIGLREPPSDSKVVRWPAALPQYNVGHAARLQRIDECLRGLPGLFLAGAAYRGIGLPACIQQGREAAEKAVAYLGLGVEATR
ncbi:MAG TPA: protoporphyrinogen oxidase [Candidatus Dormibacteraeota bacterium]